MELFEGFEEIAMTFVYMEIGDADDDEVGRSDAEGLPEIRIRGDGVEIFDVDTIWNGSDFFRRYADAFDIEIFDCLGISEIAIDQWSGHPLEDTGDEIFRVIVGRAEKGDDGDFFEMRFLDKLGMTMREKKAANHVGMKEVSDDDIRRLFDDFFSELYPRNCFYCNSSGSEFRSEFTWFLECDNGVLEGIEQGEHAQKHVFTASVSEGLNDVNNFFLLSHICHVEVYPVK